jgi:hypothetical protein
MKIGDIVQFKLRTGKQWWGTYRIEAIKDRGDGPYAVIVSTDWLHGLNTAQLDELEPGVLPDAQTESRWLSN